MNPKIEFFMSNYNNKNYIQKINNMSSNDFQQLFDNESLIYIFENVEEYELNVIMTFFLNLINEHSEYIFNNQNLLRVVATKNLFSKRVFINFPFEISEKYLKCCLDQNLDNSIISYLDRLDDKSSLECLERIHIFKDKKMILLKTAKNSNIEYIFNNWLTANDLVSLPSEELMGVLESINSVETNILKDKYFTDAIVKIFDPKIYRSIIGKLEKISDVSYIEERRRNRINAAIEIYYANTSNLLWYDVLLEKLKASKNLNEIKIELKNILGITSDLKCEFLTEVIYDFIKLNDYNSIKRIIYKLLKSEMDESLIDYHFNAVYKDINLEMNEVISYTNSISEKIIPSKRILLYNFILNFNNCVPKTKISLHRYLLKEFKLYNFYEDYKICKCHSLQNIKNNLLDENKINSSYNEYLSSKHSVPISVYNGQNFSFMVKSLHNNIDDSPLTEECMKLTDAASFSIINQDKFTTFFQPNLNYTFVYTTFEVDHVIHLSNCDTTSYFELETHKNGGRCTEFVNKIVSYKELMDKTLSYNEMIVLQTKLGNDNTRNYVPPKLKYILCYDQIEENHIQTAKNLNLGIVLVKTENYCDKSEFYNTVKSEHYYHEYGKVMYAQVL